MRRAAFLASLLLAGTARAEPRVLPLDPAHAAIAFRAYAFALVPIDGSFSRFSGELVIDPAAPGSCRVEVTVDVTSLQMPTPAIRDATLSANMLDADTFPTLAYSGACADQGIDGVLTLHGTARPLRFSILNGPASYAAEASLRRRDWGITGRPLKVGPTVRIRVSTALPP